MTTTEIVLILKDKMGIEKYQNLNKIITDEFQNNDNDELDNQNLNNIFFKYIYPQIRQYGIKIEIKTRQIILDNNFNQFKLNNPLFKKILIKLNLDDNIPFENKFNKIVEYGIENKLLHKIEHYSLWANGKIFHWFPKKSNMYGEDETNKEITNDWKLSSNWNEIYFTLYKIKDIEEFSDKWKKEKEYNLNFNSKDYVDSLFKYLDLDYHFPIQN